MDSEQQCWEKEVSRSQSEAQVVVEEGMHGKHRVSRLGRRMDTSEATMAMGNVNNIDDDMTPEFVLFIYTGSDAQTQGRRFVVEFNDIDQRSEWHSLLTTSVAAAKDEHFRAMHPGRAALLRKRCREVYTSAAMQGFVGVVIVASFCTAIAESQIIPTKGSRVARQFFLIEVVFTAIFVVELGLNMYAHWLREFLDSRANIFDTCVVLVSIISLSDDSIPGVNVLRLFRIFRMVRVFRSLTHLRILVTALSNSIVPVLYSFMLLGLVMSIYAVISTDFFREVDPENWGDFFTSLFSLFQVATGDSWASVLTHDLVHAGSDISPAVIRTFFVSFVLIVGIVLFNVVVAVLLDEFLTTVSEAKREMAMAKIETKASKSGLIDEWSKDGPLDPLINGLLMVAREDDLLQRIRRIYQRMDSDGSDGLTLEELNDGLKQFEFGAQRKVWLSHEDFDYLTEHGKFLNADGEMTCAGFEQMVVTQMRLYTNKKIVRVMSRMEDEDRDSEQYIQLLALRTLTGNTHALMQQSAAQHEAQNARISQLGEQVSAMAGQMAEMTRLLETMMGKGGGGSSTPARPPPAIKFTTAQMDVEG